MPVYNHSLNLLKLTSPISKKGLKVFLVDDGSDELCKKVIEEVSKILPSVTIISLEKNYGKGAAVCIGFEEAVNAGFTHAIQMESDGQHHPSYIDRFIELADQNPYKLICGSRAYKSMPTARARGRRISDFWVNINTLSISIHDSMCGYRLYPLDAVKKLTSNARIGQRMNFDSDIAVKLYWQGLGIVNLPVDVVYDPSLKSNFRMFWDNLHITLMHTSNFFGMLLRMPILLARKFDHE